MAQFESFRASQLYCPKCQKSMAVRERLLLVLPEKEIYEYLCSGCSSSLGKRDVMGGMTMPPVAALRSLSGHPLKKRLN